MNWLRCLGQKTIKESLGRNYFLYIAIFLSIAILIGSLDDLDTIEKPTIFQYDKIIHFGAYLVLTLSWLLAFKQKLVFIKGMLFVAAAVFIYGIIIEVLQSTIATNRQADLLDVLANFMGIVTATGFFKLFFAKKTGF